MIVFSQQVIQLLKNRQNPTKARWLENYIKHDIKSLGVGIPEIREIIQSFEKSTSLSERQLSTQIQFLDDLMKNEFTEPKLAAILYIQLYWKTEKIRDTLKLISQWFDNGWISDWNVCDWLCVRLLSPILDTDPKISVPVLATWNKSPNLWKARASLVPFAQAKTKARHREIITEFSETLIQRDERFCKTAVGWVLREYSKIDQTYVVAFLDKYKQWTTSEVVKNSTKYL